MNIAALSVNMTFRFDINSPVSDHTELFTRELMGKKYSSFSELTAALKNFEKVACIHFNIRSSALSCPGDPCIYRYLKYQCTYGDNGTKTQSTGLRKCRTKCKMCPVKFSVLQKGGYLTVGSRCSYMIHNHVCSRIEYNLHPAARKLTADEEADLMRLLSYNAPTDYVRVIARLQFGKYLTNSDIWNMRHKIARAAIGTSELAGPREIVVSRTVPIRKVSAYTMRPPVFCDKRCVISEQNVDPPEPVAANEPADIEPSLIVPESQNADYHEGFAMKEMAVIHRAQLLKRLLTPGRYSCLLDEISVLMDGYKRTIEDNRKSSESNSDTHPKPEMINSHGRIANSMPDSQTSKKFTEPSTSRVRAPDKRYSAVDLDLCFKRTLNTHENTKRPRTIHHLTMDANAPCEKDYHA